MLKIEEKLSNIYDKNFYINFLMNFKRSAHYCWIRGACFALKIEEKLSNVYDKNFYINFLMNFKRSARYC